MRSFFFLTPMVVLFEQQKKVRTWGKVNPPDHGGSNKDPIFCPYLVKPLIETSKKKEEKERD